MIYEEAIEIIEHTISCITGSYACCDHDCMFCSYRQDKDDVITALRQAIEALDNKSEAEEYRTARKTIPFGQGFFNSCPTCGKTVDYRMKFCYECGQALDWSKETK